MNKLDENYLLKRLKDGIDIKIVFMSHNSYWHYLQHLDKSYGNYHINTFGGSTDYIKLRGNNIIDDCDFILFFSSGFLIIEN